MKELLGKPAADAINERLVPEIEKLAAKGVVPTLAVVRVGARDDDLAYERGILKKYENMNCRVVVKELAADCSQEELDTTVRALDNDDSIHGILMFRPLPKTLSDENIKKTISSGKDVDCMGLNNMALLFAGDKNAFAPCTAQAVIEILHHYGIELRGKKVTVVGRSLVIGKPVSLLLIGENATVTVCHTKTQNLPSECRNADIIVACAGCAKMIKAEHLREGQVVIDVGMNTDENGKLCGDVDYTAASEIVEACTPVPRGVGSVTTSVLLQNTVRNCVRMNS